MTAVNSTGDIRYQPRTMKLLAAKKKELGTSCMKDFNFHTAHLMHTLTRVLTKQLGAAGEKAVTLALAEYVDTFGQEYLDVLDTISLDEIYPFEV